MTERPAPQARRRICFVTKTRVLGGTEKHLLDLVVGLDPTRAQSCLVCLGADVFSEWLDRGAYRGVEVVTAQEPAGFWGFRALFARLRPDVVVFVSGQLGLFPWPAYLAARAGRARRVIDIEHLIADPPPPEAPSRGRMHSRVRGLIGWRARYIARFRLAGLLSHRTVCVSEAVRRRLVVDFGYSAARTIAIPNGVDVERFHTDLETGRSVRQQLNIASDAVVIVCIASLVTQKRVDLLLEALGMLHREDREFTCIIVGDGPLRTSLEERVEALALSSSVRFIGFVPDVRPYLQAGDLFALSSDKEGLPLALLEAMASGLPCIVTDVGGNREVLVDGRTGLIVEPGSSAKFADALRYALTHPDEMRTQGRRAREHVREHWRLETTVSRLASVVCGS